MRQRTIHSDSAKPKGAGIYRHLLLILLAGTVVLCATQTALANDPAPSQYMNKYEEMTIAKFFPRSSHFSNSPFRNMSNNKDIPVAPTRAAETEAKYQRLLSSAKRLLADEESQVNSTAKVFTYWQVGEQITRELRRRHEEGEEGPPLIQRLTADLKKSARELDLCVNFYKCYKTLADVSPKLTWDHYSILIQLADDNRRQYYQTQAINGNWSAAVLEEQVQNKTEALKEPVQEEPGLLKTAYHFTFIPPTRPTDEKQTLSLFVKHISEFLKELGPEFSFVAHSIPIQIGDTTHIIDMILFHRGRPGIILVEIKADALKADDIGRFNRYIGYYRRNHQQPGEKEAIGVIFCHQVNHEEISYALDGLEKRIYVATY